MPHGDIRQLREPASKAHKQLRSGHWRTFPLLEEGVWDQETMIACPISSCLLRELPLCFGRFVCVCVCVCVCVYVCMCVCVCVCVWVSE